MSSTAPLFSLVSKEEREELERLRLIENEYQVSSLAEQPAQIVQYLAATLRLQAGHSASILRSISGMLNGSSASHNALDNITDDMSVLVGGMDRLTLGATPDSADAALAFLSQSETVSAGLQSSLAEHLDRIARLLMREQKLLKAVSQELREVYDGTALGQRIEAEKWLLSGMRRTGRDREEDFRDSLHLLRSAVEDRSGMRDYAAWFQIGWLMWKLDEGLAAAEDAFHRAQRLSASNGDLYFVKSLRYLAYTQYLQGRPDEAYETIQKALSVSADHDTRFDAARYAAARGNMRKCLDYLELCIRERPTTVIAMFAESDFLRGGGAAKFAGDMAGLASRILAEARARAEDNVGHWEAALSAVRAAEQRAGVTVELPDGVAEADLAEVPDLERMDYLTALEVERRAVTCGDTLLSVGRDALRGELRRSSVDIGKVQTEIEDAKYAQKKAALSASAWRDEQLATIPTILSHLNKSVGIQLLFPVVGIAVEASFLPVVNHFVGDMQPLAVVNGFKVTVQTFYLFVAWLPFSYVVFGAVNLVDKFVTRSHKSRIEAQHRAMLADASAEAARTIERAQTRGQMLITAQTRAQEALSMLEDI
jgi:tetratricopeptide (TPR) repeat protein